MPPADNPPFIPCTDPTDQAQRLHNAASFVEIPYDQLPWRDVKFALEIRALSGYDCYAYAHGQRWVIWDRQPEAWQESRFTPCEWAIKHGYTPEELGGSDGGDAA